MAKKQENHGAFVLEEWNASASKLVKTAVLITDNSGRFSVHREISRMSEVWRKFTAAFLPEGFPNSVTPDYMPFQIWDSLQGLSTYIRCMLSTQALLSAIGVGETTATVIGATFQGSNLDSKAKMWRLIADLMNDLGMLMDLISPLYPTTFVIILCLGSIARSFTGVASGATRAALTQHFALQQNAADISAKEGSQETMATMVGMLLGMLLSHITADRPGIMWSSFLILTFFHMFANYQAVRCLCLTSLNEERAKILLQNFMTNGQVLTPKEVSSMEHLLPNWISLQRLRKDSLFHTSVKLGAKVSSLQQSDMLKLFSSSTHYRKGQYLLLHKDGTIHIILHKHAVSADILESYIHALVLSSYMGSSTSVSNIKSADSCSWMEKYYSVFISKLQASGWKTERLLVPSTDWRAQWGGHPSQLSTSVVGMDTGGSDGSPVEQKQKKGKSKTPVKGNESILKQKSPAEFFAENKNIAGFDNPGKSLYTTVRELVENALDSAESIAELPIIEVTIEEISKSKFNTMIGLIDRERVDAELYDDFESEKDREKRLAKEAREQERQAKNIALGKKIKETPAAKNVKGRGETSFFRVTCKDNGRGMPHDDIPNMLGRVLSGTKYGLKQTRGKFGLGAKMALIWSKMSTGLPIEISSSMKGQNYVSLCRLDIDIHKNIPHVHLHEKRDKKEKWHGAEIQVTIEGNWTTYRSKIIHYMRQMAVITPYAQFLFRYIAGTADKNVTIRFARRTDAMPPAPVETKYHPSAVDLLLIKRLIAETSKQNLLQFLQHEFVNISKSYADRLIGEMGPDFTAKMSVKSLSSQQIVRIHQLFRQAKFDDPSGECLSPAGEYNLRLGIIKELHPDMVATYEGSPHIFEGHPFIVEAGVSLGGKDVKQGINVFRFANRIPLLFEQGGDVVTRTVMKRINWNSYKINQAQDKIGVFVSIVSTKIPFKGTGKEYIGDDITEIASAVKSAIQQCCIQLKSKIVKKQQARERQERKRNLNRYIPDVSRAVYDVLKEVVQIRKTKKQKYGNDYDEILDKVSSREVTESTLKEKLTQHVEQVDNEMALEYATQSGMTQEARETSYLHALEGMQNFIDYHSPVCVIRLFRGS